MPLSIQTSTAEKTQRDWRQAVWRGMLCRCPACGNGKLFRAFLKPVEHCESCGENLSHQRADDLPPYIVIMIVGHVVVGGLLLAEQYADWSFTAHMIIWPSLVLVLSLAMMQPAKGAVIGLQWALGMHGFDHIAHDIERQTAQKPEPGMAPGSIRREGV